ncbi:YkvA family protein [Vibrio splendidus]|uniref:YkvA family protein n=1 Tax=Vibrio splendidus TaxID=29497 RepID=UPI0022358CE6|nr:YkvA family protein [Vibrio splendidus]MCW4441071.1 YkvA family protein [Vibrio splendidus]
MGISKEQEEKARKQFYEDIKDVDDTDVEYASKKGNKKLDQLDSNPPGALSKLWNDIKLMMNLITDYVKGDYTDVPWRVIAAITGAIVYFASPIDVIPDFIPVVGYLDDALVIKLAIDLASEDFNEYKRWKAC